MQGTILILDAVSTNRIMLKVQLSAAWYHVVQADRLQGVRALIQRCQPDLIIAAMDLPDGRATQLPAMLAGDAHLSRIPIVAVTAQNDQTARLRALEAGVDDVLSQPIDDLMLQARIRRLLRASSELDTLGFDQSCPHASPGLAEQPGLFLHQAQDTGRVALLTQDARTGPLWRSQLSAHWNGAIESYPMQSVQALMQHRAPDAIVLELPKRNDGIGLRLLADLRARSAMRGAVVIAVPNPADSLLAAEALDRGAHDALPHGFCAPELALRLSAQLTRKAASDRLRTSVQNGLKDAMRDPMTGLYNRRYALPKLAHMARRATECHRDFALMMVDLDHFKQINDRFGHQSGDAVLVETAYRMRSCLNPASLIARVGGEEFLIGLPDSDSETALGIADHLCRRINEKPFHVPGASDPIRVTTSIGIAIGPGRQTNGPDPVAPILNQADQALYSAKTAGRNQVTLACAAA